MAEKKKKGYQKVSPLVVGISGAIGGSVEALVNWPSEVLH
jgi:hypothetical protein